MKGHLLDLSAWTGQPALDAFARAMPHLRVIGRLRPHMGPTRFAFWTVKGSELAITWDEAMERLMRATPRQGRVPHERRHPTQGGPPRCRRTGRGGCDALAIGPGAIGVLAIGQSRPAGRQSNPQPDSNRKEGRSSDPNKTEPRSLPRDHPESQSTTLDHSSSRALPPGTLAQGADCGHRRLRQERAYPGFGQHSGVITSTALMVVPSGGLYRLFKRLDWL